MTAVCLGGTSSPQVGALDTSYGGGALAAYFASKGIPYLSEVALFLGLVPFVVSTACANDPPAMPTWTKADSDALLNLDLTGGFVAAAAKAKDILHNLLWYDLCKCDSMATPAGPAVPAAPAGLTIINVGGGPNADPCYEYTETNVHQISDVSGGFITSAGWGPNTLHLGLPYQPFYSVPAGSPWQTARWVVHNVVQTAPGHTFQMQMWRQGPAGGTNDQLTVNVAPGATGTLSYAFDPRYPYVLTQINNVSGTGASWTNMDFNLWCSSNFGSSQACCPPDPILAGMVSAILQAVTLIQRQAVPFAYVSGNLHSALSGAGTFSIQGLLGVKVEVTTLPGALGAAGTTPTEYFDAGFITFGTPDGYDHSRRLEHNPQLILPARCSAFTDLAYDLHPGVVITLTELIREP